MSIIKVSYLEMRSPEELRPPSAVDERFQVKEATVKQWELNRFLYWLVGRDWSWNEKKGWTDEQWRRYAESDGLRTLVGFYDGSVAGYCEIRRDDLGDVEIAIFGLTPKFIGHGLGGALLSSALAEAWRMKPGRVWLHTCSLDHPAALGNYQARGMRIYKEETITVSP